MIVVALFYALVTQSMKNNISKLLKRDSYNAPEIIDEEEKKKNEKENINFIKSKYLPDSKPIFITIREHNIDEFIKSLEKAVF